MRVAGRPPGLVAAVLRCARVRDDALCRLGRLPEAHGHAVAPEAEAPGQRQAVVILRSLEGRQGRFERLVGMSGPVLRGGVQLGGELGDPRLGRQPLVGQPLCGVVGLGQDGVGLGEGPHLAERLPEIDEQLALLGRLVDDGSRSTEEVGCSRHVATTHRPPAGRAEALRCLAPEIAPVPVKRAELPEVAVRLLEVVGEDLLVLALAPRSRVDAHRPRSRTLVQLGPCPLQQVLVGGLPDQNVVEAIAFLVERADRACG